MLITILASIGSHNLGDELILKNEIKLLREEYKSENPKFVIYSYDYKNPFYKENDIEYREYFPIDSRKKRNLFRNLYNFLVFIYFSIKSDLVVIGGGGIFYDSEKQSVSNPLKSWLLRTNILKFLRKKIYFYAVGLNIKNDENKSIIQKIFFGTYRITVRDEYSKNLLSELKLESEIINDPVFYDRELNPDFKKKLCIKKLESRGLKIDDIKYIDFSGKKIGVAFRQGYFSQSKNDKMELYLIKEFLEYIISKGGEVVLLPHSFHKSDIKANDYLWLKQISKLLGGVEIAKNMQETYSYYNEHKLDMLFAQRLHSIILSYTYDIEFISISYTQKTKEVLKKIG